MTDAASDGLEAAARRLEQALAGLELRVAARLEAGGAPPPGGQGDATGLLVELEAERRRGRELEQVAAEASAALGRAAAEVRAALSAQG